MTLILLNLQSNQQIKLNNENPFIIGRGNVEGCFDKRVSRNHGKITCTLDGKIRLEALHYNPCFITRNGVPPILQINKNEEETLSEGDFLGLLPNAFWFKITTDKDIKIKRESPNLKTEITCDESNQINDLEEIFTTTDKDNEKLDEKEGASLSSVKNEENLDSSPNLKVNPSFSSRGFGTPEFEKTRRLPLWMYEIDEVVEKNQSANKRTIENDKLINKKQKTSTESEIKIDPDSKSGSSSKVEEDLIVSNVPSTSRVVNIEETVPNPSTEPEEATQTQDSPREVNKNKEGYESDVNNEEGSGTRPICQYESNCYRKNPQHKLEFSHPGDSDYVPYNKRPFCPYGAKCYRKNEKHKVEFQHLKPSTSSSRDSIASSPLPAKRRRKKIRKENSDVEDSDEYDLEDPFINDASSDDYVPTDSDFEEEEDFDESRDDD